MASAPMSLFSIYDVQTEVWTAPMVDHNENSFCRNLAAQLANADPTTQMMARHPEDFELWFLGFFIDGKINVHMTAIGNQGRLVCRLHQLVKRSPKGDLSPNEETRHAQDSTGR